jgi:hypothetical protein
VIATRTKPAKTPKKWKDRLWTFAELVAELPETHAPTTLWDGEFRLETSEYRLVGHWHPDETVHSRLLKGFEAPGTALFEGA